MKLSEQKWVPIQESAAVDAFYAELTSRYPEIDSVPEEELENCPWSCAFDRSGRHVLMPITWSRCAEIAPVVLDLAVKHGLVCYDPQESKVHLPSQLKRRPSRFWSWCNRIRMLVGGVGLIAFAIVVSFAQEFDPHDPAMIANGLNRADAVVVGKFGVNRCLPWFDGWHCGGAIHVKEVLYGDWKPNAVVQFRWRERYVPTCLVCEKVSRFHGKAGIWLLAKRNGEWKVSGTQAVWCGVPLPMDCRDEVVQCIRQRSAK